ncbi:caspase family protein [Cypionkella psychrotolerans]|uniref:caspase family protein n=1 Tax=Cypionkella psychrotolerans TaxID=1678131 RepID=UPI0006B5FFB4|nr:caspase family protein [Cypionkella psychrotolerans]
MPQPGYSAPMLQIFRSTLCKIVQAGLLAALPLPAHAELRAVLVGVSDYLTLDADLKGPVNDVRLMAEVLIARGIPAPEIAVLTSDPTDLPAGVTTAPTTKAAILTALTNVSTRAQPGDTVVFYFSGHGAQAPDQSGDEGGGYDEIFLPADAAGWKGDVGTVENALTDDELQAWAQPLLSRGIKLIGLIDACHADTGFRSLPNSAAVARGLSPADLNIPDNAASAPSVPAPPLSGDFAFLYSSQSDQRSFEYPVGDSDLWQGAFTRQLAEVLRSSPKAPWAQILAAAAATMQQGTSAQMPDGEGPMLNENLFGTPAPQRFLVQNGTLKAGLLQGLNPGDELSLYTAPAGGTALMHVTLTKVMARSSTLPQGAPAAAWAELDQPATPPPLRLAAAQLANPNEAFDYTPWIAALAPYATQTTPDLTPILTDGDIALAGPDGQLDPKGPGSTPHITLQDGDTPALAVARTLAQAAHNVRLRRLLASVAGRGLTAEAPLKLDWQRKPAPGCATPGPAEPFDPAKAVQPCDQLWLGFQNQFGRDLDISILYFNTDFSITPLWPAEGLSNRLAAGESGKAGFQIDANSPPVDEDILVLAVPVEPGAARVDLTTLADPAATRGGGDWLSNRLNPDPTATRSFSAKPAPLLMIRQAMRIRPAPQGDE